MSTKTGQSSILEGLNERQVEAVTAGEGPILCVAGAGSGKTTVLTRRVAWLASRGVAPQSILLLTFTRAASASMLGRAKALDPRAAEVAGGTFHSVGAWLMRQNPHVLGLPDNFTVLDAGDSEGAVKLCMEGVTFPEGDASPRASTIHKAISYAYNTKCEIPDAIAKVAPKYTLLAGEFEKVRDRYVDYKLSNGLLDFDDLLGYFAIMLEDPYVANTLRSRFKYVLVDEHQDSNPIQLDALYGLSGAMPTSFDGVIGGLSEAVPNSMVVGDPAQAIYGFRGAAPETMFDFRKRYPGCRVILLEENYRSVQAVLDLANAVDRAMVPRFERSLRSGRGKKGERPVVVRCRDYDHESEELCDRIVKSRQSGAAFSDHAVIVRSMSKARRIEAAFIAKKIPYKVVGGIRIDEAAHVKDMLSIGRVVDNVKCEPAWMRLFGMFPKVGMKTARKMAAAACAAPDARTAAKAAAMVAKKIDLTPLQEAISALSSDSREA